MKRLLLCLLFVFGLVLAGCESSEGEGGERRVGVERREGYERGRIQVADQSQQVEVAVTK